MKMKAPGDESYNPKCSTDSTKPGSNTSNGMAVAPGGNDGSVKSKKRDPKYL